MRQSLLEKRCAEENILNTLLLYLLKNGLRLKRSVDYDNFLNLYRSSDIAL